MGGLISKGKRNGKGNLRVPTSNGAVFCSPSKLHYPEETKSAVFSHAPIKYYIHKSNSQHETIIYRLMSTRD